MTRSRPILLVLALLLAPGAASAIVPVRDAPGARPVVRAQAIITRTNQLPTAELRRLRKRMLNDQYVSYRDMRRLADAGDGLAAYEYGKRLLELEDPALRSDAAMYFASAAYAGRDYAMWPLLRLLEGPEMEMSQSRRNHLENTMRILAKRGNPEAAEALVEYYVRGKPFGLHPDRAASLLLEMSGSGGAEAAMSLVATSFSGESELSEDRVRDLLELVMEDAETLGQKAMAQNLLARLESRSEDG